MHIFDWTTDVHFSRTFLTEKLMYVFSWTTGRHFQLNNFRTFSKEMQIGDSAIELLDNPRF